MVYSSVVLALSFVCCLSEASVLIGDVYDVGKKKFVNLFYFIRQDNPERLKSIPNTEHKTPKNT